ncbi:hypothetical protein CGRA01v4_06799 [Colletotrichum graminicola]|nr:hypothetical protein CGRA01v4_06799 [Colletotrichum graminicola]
MVLMVQYTVLLYLSNPLIYAAERRPILWFAFHPVLRSVRNSDHRATANPPHPEAHRIQAVEFAGVYQPVC